MMLARALTSAHRCRRGASTPSVSDFTIGNTVRLRRNPQAALKATLPKLLPQVSGGVAVDVLEEVDDRELKGRSSRGDRRRR